MNIVEFLNARIAENEAAAMAASVPGAGYEPHPIPGTVLLARNVAARTLAECEAKRAIVELHSENHDCPMIASDGCHTSLDCLIGYDPTDTCGTLRALASVYADHPDYDPAWAL